MEGQRVKLKKVNYKKVGAAIGLLLLVLLTLTVLFNRDRLTLAHLTRAIQYRNLGTAALAEEFHFTSPARTFALLGDGLAVASPMGVAVYDRTGSQVYAVPMTMGRPMIASGGDFILVYDLGGVDIFVGNARGELHRIEAEGPIVDVRINENGWVTVSAEVTGTLGLVRVYNPQGQARYRVQAGAGTGHLMGAALAADNRTLVMLTITETGGRAAWFYIDTDGMQYEHIEEGELFFDFWFTSRRGDAGFVSSNMVRFLSNQGESQGEHRFHDRHLRAYHADGARIALHLTPHPAGAGGELVLVEATGVVHETDVTGNLFDISLRGRYLAALSFDRLVIYRGDRVYATWDETEGMDHLLTREDGTVFLLSSHRARLLVP